MSNILIVDDNTQNLAVLGELLSPEHDVRAANSGPRALRLLAHEPPPDLVLLDVMMPGMSGWEVLERMRADRRLRDVPVIFATAMDDADDERRGFELGAVDYITKPLRPAAVRARVQAQLAIKRARDRLRCDNSALEAEVERRTQEIQLVQDVTIRALARLAETRDNETGNHVLRTQEYVEALARRASGHPRFAPLLDERSIVLIAKSAPLHDIGKVGIPDAILLKPGRLDAAEWQIMKTHAKLGADAIERAEADAQRPLPFLQYAKQVAMHHHERWDGTGYPGGLAGDAIPLAARLMALADVFDALTSARVYKPALSFEAARAIIADDRGRQFDPDLLAIFLDGYDTFCAIARRHPDEPAASGGAPGAA